MATRRIISTEKTILDQDERNPQEAPTKSNIAPAVPSSVIIKLLGFTAAMIIGPIGTYFLSLNTIYKGNATWAGATAALVANVVLILYIIIAFREDETDRREAEEQARKGQ